MQFRNNMQATALTINGVTTGNKVAGPTLLTFKALPGTLSARCVVDAETTSITLSAIWEVSQDGTTFIEARGLSNATPVVLATGTAGADAVVSRAVDAPAAVYGYRYARCSILVAGATGGAADLATVGYDYNASPYG